jgi:hypothetical protein
VVLVSTQQPPALCLARSSRRPHRPPARACCCLTSGAATGTSTSATCSLGARPRCRTQPAHRCADWPDLSGPWPRDVMPRMLPITSGMVPVFALDYPSLPARSPAPLRPRPRRTRKRRMARCSRRTCSRGRLVQRLTSSGAYPGPGAGCWALCVSLRSAPRSWHFCGCRGLLNAQHTPRTISVAQRYDVACQHLRVRLMHALPGAPPARWEGRPPPQGLSKHRWQ